MKISKVISFLSRAFELSFAILITMIVCFGVVKYFRDSQKKNLIVQSEIAKEKKEEKILRKKIKKYIKSIRQICDKKPLEITGIELYRCVIINDPAEKKSLDAPMGFEFEIEHLKEHLKNPSLPSFCKRKVKEITANEVVDCLQEKSNPDAQDYMDYPEP